MKNETQPIPGKPVRGSKTGQVIMALFDLLGRSWAKGIIWRLNNRPSTFRKLQEYCENISPTTLNRRLKELTNAYLIERSLDGYQLTKQGQQLYELIYPLGKWAKEGRKLLSIINPMRKIQKPKPSEYPPYSEIYMSLIDSDKNILAQLWDNFIDEVV